MFFIKNNPLYDNKVTLVYLWDPIPYKDSIFSIFCDNSIFSKLQNYFWRIYTIFRWHQSAKIMTFTPFACSHFRHPVYMYI